MVSPRELYPKATSILENILGSENYKVLEPYLHTYDGTENSVKPLAKHITIYWIGRSTDRMILRTEGEDDIILSQIGKEAVPTIIFRKLKAVYLREFMKLLRNQWHKYSADIRNILGPDYDFISKCSLSPGIAGEGKGVMHGRCMKCPADVLMGATSAGELYNLVSRFVGDSAYALTPSFERRTGNAVDEVTYTTIMLRGRISEEEARTGGLFSETLVEPNTLFIGKFVLSMPAPPELLYMLWLFHRTIRVGARTSIWGTLEVYPIIVIGDVYEVGTSFTAAERALGLKDLNKAKEKLLEYIEKEVKYATSSKPIIITKDIANKLKNMDSFNKDLVVELWNNAKNYIDGVKKYIGV